MKIALAAALSFALLAPHAFAGDKAPKDKAAGDAQLSVAADESPKVEELIHAGAPATDREWTSADYKRLLAVLEDLAKQSPRKLPRFDSAASGTLMTRLVSEENFNSIRNEKLPLQMRLQEAVALTDITGNLLLVYVGATNKGESFDRELVELCVYVVKVNTELWRLADEFIGTLSAEERSSRAEAFDQMRSGTAQMAEGIMTTFSETQTYRPAELRRFARMLRPCLPDMMRRLSNESAADVTEHLREIIASTKDPELATELKALLAAIENAAKAQVS